MSCSSPEQSQNRVPPLLLITNLDKKPHSQKLTNTKLEKTIVRSALDEYSANASPAPCAVVRSSSRSSSTICSLLKHGTIEFRQHKGTTSLDAMVSWIEFVHKLVEYAIASNVDQLMGRGDDVQGKYHTTQTLY